MVFHAPLVRQQDAMPLKRDNLFAAEESLGAAERNARPPVRLAGE